MHVFDVSNAITTADLNLGSWLSGQWKLRNAARQSTLLETSIADS